MARPEDWFPAQQLRPRPPHLDGGKLTELKGRVRKDRGLIPRLAGRVAVSLYREPLHLGDNETFVIADTPRFRDDPIGLELAIATHAAALASDVAYGCTFQGSTWPEGTAPPDLLYEELTRLDEEDVA